MPFGNALVTTAEGAQTLTEGEMNVQADPLAGIAFHKCLIDRAFPVVLVDRFVLPVWNRRIAGITRPGNVVFLN